MILFFGGALGLVSLLLAAFLHHNSVAIVPIENFNAIKIAVNYTQINAGLISVLGLFILWPRLKAAKRLLYWISVLLALGTFLFCLGVLASNFSHIHILSAFAPVGGVFMIFSWFLLMVLGLLSFRKHS